MIKKYNEHIQQEYEYEDEDDTPELIIIGSDGYQETWGGKAPYCIFILENWDQIKLKNREKDDVVLFDNWIWHNGDGRYTILSEDELENHIYNDETKIVIMSDNDEYTTYFWSKLPKDIKYRIK